VLGLLESYYILYEENAPKVLNIVAENIVAYGQE
jgi:hypothetical protein